jgi:hypothetical protein
VAGAARRRITLDKVHKWAGLAACLWLAVLAVTGLMQLQRTDWRWQWASGLPISEEVARHDDKQLWRYHQIDPARPATRVVAGAAGAWLSRDGGQNWQRLAFAGDPVRNVQALEPAKVGGQWTVYAGTDDGVWLLDPATRGFVRAGLAGRVVNSLSIGNGEAMAAVNNSLLLHAEGEGAALNWQSMEMGSVPAAGGPARVDLGRFLQDIHVGRGIFGGLIDKWIWLVTAAGLFVISLTGFAYWAIMRWCNTSRKRPKDQRPSSAALRRAQKAIQWSFRAHAMIFGIVLAIPLLLVFVTGIYQDHRGDVQQALRTVNVPPALLTPSYRGSGWMGQVSNVALAEDARGPFIAIGNRRGMFISRDGGANWAREAGFRGPAMRLRRIAGRLYVPGRMMRRVQVRGPQGWQVLDVPRPVVMVNEMSEGPRGTIWWTRGEGIFRTTGEGQMRGRADHRPPELGYLPWASFATELHKGALISEQWKWVNDLVALLGITLVVTGFLRWRKRRW